MTAQRHRLLYSSHDEVNGGNGHVAVETAFNQFFKRVDRSAEHRSKRRPLMHALHHRDEREHEIYRTRLHKIVFLRSIVLGVSALALTLLAGLAYFDLVERAVTTWGGLFATAAAILLLIIAAPLAFKASRQFMQALRDYMTLEYILTEKRVLVRHGLIEKEMTDLALYKIESRHSQRTLFGLLFNYGTISLSGAGSNVLILYKIARPNEFLNHIAAIQPNPRRMYSEIHGYEDGDERPHPDFREDSFDSGKAYTDYADLYRSRNRNGR